MTNDEVVSFLKGAGLGTGMAATDVIVVSGNYSLPSRDWLAGEFSSALKTDLLDLGAAVYVDERNNCNKFGLYAMALASLMHNQTSTQADSLAFGFIHYLRQVNFPPVPHEINFALIEEAGAHALVWFEPQLQGIVTLSPDELASIFRIYV